MKMHWLASHLPPAVQLWFLTGHHLGVLGTRAPRSCPLIALLAQAPFFFFFFKLFIYFGCAGS